MDNTNRNPRAILVDDMDFIISDLVIEKWQRTVDLLAKILRSNTARISRALPEYFETVVTSSNEANGDKHGARYLLTDGRLNWYCKMVYDSRKPLCVNDSSNDVKEFGFSSLDAEQHGVKSYLGYPIQLPDGGIFGTICVEDGSEEYGSRENDVLFEFKQIIEDDIRHLIDLFHYYADLNNTNELATQLNTALSKGLDNLKISVKGGVNADGDVATLISQQSIQIERLKNAIDRSLHINSHRMRAPLARILGLVRILNVKYDSNDEILVYLNKSANELDLIIHEVQNAMEPNE